MYCLQRGVLSHASSQLAGFQVSVIAQQPLSCFITPKCSASKKCNCNISWTGVPCYFHNPFFQIPVIAQRKYNYTINITPNAQHEIQVHVYLEQEFPVVEWDLRQVTVEAFSRHAPGLTDVVAASQHHPHARKRRHKSFSFLTNKKCFKLPTEPTIYRFLTNHLVREFTKPVTWWKKVVLSRIWKFD